MKHVVVFLSVVVLWIVLILVSPVYFGSTLVNLAIAVVVPGIATIASLIFTYRLLPKRRFLSAIAVFFLGFIIAYPFYGPDGVADNISGFGAYRYCPMISMFLCSFLCLYWCEKRVIRQ